MREASGEIPLAYSPEVIAILNREADAAMKHPEVRARLEALGFDRWTEPPEYFGALIKSECDKYDKYGKVARRGRIAEASTIRSFCCGQLTNRCSAPDAGHGSIMPRSPASGAGATARGSAFLQPRWFEVGAAGSARGLPL